MSAPISGDALVMSGTVDRGSFQLEADLTAAPGEVLGSWGRTEPARSTPSPPRCTSTTAARPTHASPRNVWTGTVVALALRPGTGVGLSAKATETEAYPDPGTHRRP
jgi:hypothetical protein